MMSISKSKPDNVAIDGRQIEFKNEIKTLGLNLKRTGIVGHITERVNIARKQTEKLKRFAKLSVKTKLYLYKSLIRPIVEYPTIPNALASKKQISNIQKIQNKNLRLIVKNDPDLRYQTMEDIHNRLQLEPINIRFSIRLQKLWDKFAIKEQRIYNQSIEDHNWWKRSASKIKENEGNLLIPMYT